MPTVQAARSRSTAGLGRQIKIYMGDEDEGWLEDDENLKKWENNELTVSDRRILLAHW